MHRRAPSLLVLGSAVLLAAACVKPPAPMQPKPVPPNADSLARVRADSIARADSLAREMERRQREADSLLALQEAKSALPTEDMMTVLRKTVYFDFDQAALSDEARATLDAKVTILKSRPRLRILVTGHTDVRGSTEYNIALGLRRAGEVKNYLVASGLSDRQIETTSMGAERPAAQGNSEGAWAKNRRAEFAPISGE